MEPAVAGPGKPLRPEAADPTGRLSTSSRLGRPLREAGRFLSVLVPAPAFLAAPFTPTEHVDRDEADSGSPGPCMSLQGQRRVETVSHGLLNGREAQRGAQISAGWRSVIESAFLACFLLFELTIW